MGFRRCLGGGGWGGAAGCVYQWRVTTGGGGARWLRGRMWIFIAFSSSIEREERVKRERERSGREKQSSRHPTEQRCRRRPSARGARSEERGARSEERGARRRDVWGGGGWGGGVSASAGINDALLLVSASVLPPLRFSFFPAPGVSARVHTFALATTARAAPDAKCRHPHPLPTRPHPTPPSLPTPYRTKRERASERASDLTQAII